MTSRRALPAVCLVVLVMVAAACRPAAERFAELDGPLRENVVFPNEFGVDVSTLSVPVAPLLRAVSPQRLRSRVDAIDVIRPDTSAGGRAAADYIDTKLSGMGLTVRRQHVAFGGETMPNVLADKAGTTCPERLFVVGAHYDSVAAGPGADDNASGVAGMLEIARVLQDTGLPISVRFAGFALEENGLYGSRVMAQALRNRNAQVVGMVSLEMIGFTTSGQDQFVGTENDYLGMAGDPASEYLARVFGAASFAYNNFFFAFGAVIDPAVLPDIRRSDNAAFWDQGYRALILTDTANFRNPNYHTATDTIDTLDFGFMANSVRSTIAGLVAVATVDANDNDTPDACE
jgi:aminopeptidase YwaD